MRVVQISEAGGPLELHERETPEPAPGEVRVEVQACGVCHSDSYAKEGHFPGVTFPVVPGHEVAGVVDAIGEGVHGWKVGERVGVGWFGGNCGYCEPCRRGDLVNILGVVSVFAVLASWKDFLWPLLVLTNPDRQPLSVRLPTIKSQTELGVFLAALFIASLVPIIGFLIFQRSFLRGTGLGGAIKG